MWIWTCQLPVSHPHNTWSMYNDQGSNHLLSLDLIQVSTFIRFLYYHLSYSKLSTKLNPVEYGLPCQPILKYCIFCSPMVCLFFVFFDFCCYLQHLQVSVCREFLCLLVRHISLLFVQLSMESTHPRVYPSLLLPVSILLSHIFFLTCSVQNILDLDSIDLSMITPFNLWFWFAYLCPQYVMLIPCLSLKGVDSQSRQMYLHTAGNRIVTWSFTLRWQSNNN